MKTSCNTLSILQSLHVMLDVEAGIRKHFLWLKQQVSFSLPIHSSLFLFIHPLPPRLSLPFLSFPFSYRPTPAYSFCSVLCCLKFFFFFKVALLNFQCVSNDWNRSLVNSIFFSLLLLNIFLLCCYVLLDYLVLNPRLNFCYCWLSSILIWLGLENFRTFLPVDLIEVIHSSNLLLLPSSSSSKDINKIM